MTRALVALTLAAVAGASAAHAQETLLPSTGWGLGTAVSAWHFSSPLPQAGGSVANIAEVAVPFRVRTVFGRWSMDLSGAAAFGGVHLAATPSAAGAGGEDEGEDRLVSIFGPTDVKLRVTGPLRGDNLLLTLGLNLPTGKVGLDGDETSALQVIGAPAVRMPIGAFGSGAGATLGVIRAFQGDEWALAVGGSVEQRSEYSPIALLLAGGKSETRVTPGTAAHLTLGIDRAVGEGRLSALVVGNIFSQDKVRFGTGAAESRADFTLGPQVTVTSKLDFAGAAWRESSLGLAARVRSEFSDSAGAKVTGSGGTYLEGSIGGVRGGATGAGFIIGADARWHSGLEFTDALVGAAVSAVGLTIGVESAGVSRTTRFVVHGQYGSFDTGRASTTGFGVTLGLSVGARRGAR